MSSLVVMSKGTKFTQQSYKVSDSFPFEWIKKKWREAFHVTAMATSGTQWAVVMSRGAGFLDQVGGSWGGWRCEASGQSPILWWKLGEWLQDYVCGPRGWFSKEVYLCRV